MMKRIVLAVVLIVGLTFLIGFFAGFSGFLTGWSTTPGWVHIARSVLIWIAVVAVYAWFVAGTREHVVRSTLIVMIAAYLIGVALATGGLALARSIGGTQVPILTFELLDMAQAVARAVLGFLLGSTIRARRMKA